MWDLQANVNHNWLKLKIERVLKDQWIQKWQRDVEQKPSCYLYEKYKTVYKLEKYLTLDSDLKWQILKIRTLNNKLPIVVGRYNGIERENRKCTLCRMNEIGDEYHFVLVCNNENLRSYREQHIPLYFRTHPNLRKFVELINSGSMKLLENFSRYLKKSFVLL